MFLSRTPSISLGTKSILLGLLLTSAALPVTASASSIGPNPGLEFPVGKSVNYTAALSKIAKTADTTTLDYRKPSTQLRFDLTYSERTESLELVIAADPLGRVAPNAPIMVQFNNHAPVPVYHKGRGFDARIPLKGSHARSRSNIVKISYPTPAGAECLTAQNGAWSIDLKNSSLRVKSRAKMRAVQMREIESRLAMPALSPERVGLIASGPNATKLQALAAQGIGLRMTDLPSFTTRKGAGDFEILMVRRDDLHRYTKDPAILGGSGPRAFVPRTRPIQLILTGDTEAQLLSLVETFSNHRLPNARRNVTSQGEIRMQSILGQQDEDVSGPTRLNTLVGGYEAGFMDQSWESGPQTYRFSVADPAATSGDLILRLSSTKTVADTSKLRVTLNGEMLGAAKLDKRRKTVGFEIKPGQLRGDDNVLALLPEIESRNANVCLIDTIEEPRFHIGAGSKLDLVAAAPSPITDLSRFAATGAPFADAAGAGSYIALPGQAADYNASLKVLARIAKAAGHTLADADYGRVSDLAQAGDRHVLVIGPAQKLARSVRDQAPIAFRSAMAGKPSNGENLLTAEIERFVSNGDGWQQDYAARVNRARRVGSGGVAAMFGTQGGKVVGVITNAPGERFSRAADNLVAETHWNAIEGGVSRWNQSSVLMAQLAQPVPGYVLPKTGSEFSVANVQLPNWAADLQMPEFSLPEFGAPDFSGVASTAAAFGASLKAIPARFSRPEKVTVSSAYEAPTFKPEPAKVSPYSAIKPAPSFTLPAKKAEPKAVKQAELSTAQMRDTKRKLTEAKPIIAPTLKLPKLRGPISQKHTTTTLSWKRKLDLASDRSRDWVRNLDRKIERKRTELGWGRKLERLQGSSKTQPLKKSLKDMSPIKRLPGANAAKWGDQNMSAMAILLMIAFAALVLLLGLARPVARTGGHH